MALGVSDVREVVERVCARPDVLDACRRRDLGIVIEVLGSHGVAQGQIAGLTGISQGRLSQYMNHKIRPKHSSIFEKFADGLGMPPVTRQALGLTPESATASVSALAGKPSLDVGLIYPDTPAEARENVARLWHADLGGAPLLQARLDPGAWNDASLRWLIDPGRRPDSEIARGVRIGVADVDRFRTTMELFRQLDDRFGGGHAREALVQYLSADAERMLHGRYTENVGRDLFSATAEATLLAAWMSYDSAPGSSLAQRYFIQALALAQAGDDRLLGASVLDAMSHQATYTGRFREAANLAKAAMTGARGIATPTLTSHFTPWRHARSLGWAMQKAVIAPSPKPSANSSGVILTTSLAGSGTLTSPSCLPSSGIACVISGGPQMPPSTRAAAWLQSMRRRSCGAISSP
jgi:transcriptional regulator with XRE-family HTH domain